MIITTVDVDVRKIREHYEVYDNKTGEFCFSADNLKEVSEGLQEMEEAVT